MAGKRQTGWSSCVGSAGKQRREQMQARARKRKRVGIAAGVVAVFAAATALLASLVGGSADPADAAGRMSAPPWDPQTDGLAERLAPFKFPPVGDESFHAHVLLTVYRNGEQVAVPANVGFESGGAHSSLHTHTPDGLVHMEADDPYPYELTHFFRAWDVAFDGTRLGGDVASGTKQVFVYVNGKPAPAGPVILKDKDNIVVAYGEPGSFPTAPPVDALKGS